MILWVLTVMSQTILDDKNQKNKEKDNKIKNIIQEIDKLNCPM